MIRLLILDAGSTLGEFQPPGKAEIAALSPLPPHAVHEVMRRFLHCSPVPTREVLEDLCEALVIDIDRLPQTWDSGFTAFPYAPGAVNSMVEKTGGIAVVLSNLPCTTGPSRMRDLHKQFPVIESIYTSYSMGRRKPDRRLWHQIFDNHGVTPEEALHIGDIWSSDVHGAIRAGCRVVFLSDTRPGNTPPPREDWPAGEDRITVVPDLSHAVSVVEKLHGR